jgi:hypothetical protein
MDQLLTQYLALFERRLTVMRQLAVELERGQRSVVQFDGELLAQQSAQQLALCEELHAMETELGRLYRQISDENKHSAAAADSSPLNLAGERGASLREELVRVQRQVQHLGRVHAALLRRARRSLTALTNVLAIQAPTYSPPRPDVLAAGNEGE